MTGRSLPFLLLTGMGPPQVLDSSLEFRNDILNLQARVISPTLTDQDMRGENGIGNRRGKGVPPSDKANVLFLTPEDLQPLASSRAAYGRK